MKMVMALVRNERLQKVQDALLKAGITGFTISATLGMGELRKSGVPPGRQGMVQHIRVEAAVPDTWTDRAVNILRDASATGHAGDGLIFVYRLDRAVKIRSGQEGEDILIPRPLAAG